MVRRENIDVVVILNNNFDYINIKLVKNILLIDDFVWLNVDV